MAQQEGQRFDPNEGRPESWSPDRGDLKAHDWVRRFISEQWDEWQPRSRTSAVEEMSRLLPLLHRPKAPECAGLRRYLVISLRIDVDNEANVDFERWMDRWCYTLAELDRSILAEVDRQLGYRLDGGLLAASTATRYRRTARTCISRAVDLELIDSNPWPPPQRGAKNRKIRRREKAVDIKRLPNPAAVRRALDALINHQPASRIYRALIATMIYGGLRPSEAVMLRRSHLFLPETGWGKIFVEEADIDFDEPGDPKTGNRQVPIPPVLVEILANRIDEAGIKPEGRLFRTGSDTRPTPSNLGRAWHRALKKIGHESLSLYDCRHTAATTWLSAGVPLGETARRMGHSVETLVAYYVGALNGDEEAGNDAIDTYLQGFIDDDTSPNR